MMMMKKVHEAKTTLAMLQEEEDIKMEKHFRKTLNEVSEKELTNDIFKVFHWLFALRKETYQAVGSGNQSSGIARNSQKGHGRKSTRMTKPSLVAAAGSLLGARRSTTKGIVIHFISFSFFFNFLNFNWI